MKSASLKEQIEKIRAHAQACRQRAEELEALIPGLEYAMRASTNDQFDALEIPKLRIFSAQSKKESSKRRTKIRGAKVKRLSLSGKTRRVVEVLAMDQKPLTIKQLCQQLRDISEPSLRTILFALAKRKLVISPSRGFYAITPAALELLRITAQQSKSQTVPNKKTTVSSKKSAVNVKKKGKAKTA